MTKMIRVADFNENLHKYFWQGSEFPSFSQILSEVGTVKIKKSVDPFDETKTITEKEEWKSISGSENMVGDHIRVGADFGDAFHETVKMFYKYGEEAVEYDDALEPYLNQWRQFKKDFPHTPIQFGTMKLVEIPLFSKLYRIAGMPDCIALGPDGSVWILDWKTVTTWAKRSIYRMQAAFYGVLYQTSYIKKSPAKKPRAKIVRFNGKSPSMYEVEELSYAEMRSEFNKFLSILTTWKIGKGLI